MTLAAVQFSYGHCKQLYTTPGWFERSMTIWRQFEWSVAADTVVVKAVVSGCICRPFPVGGVTL